MSHYLYFRKSTLRATIYSFVLQNLTQYIHWQPWYFRNDLRL